LAQEHIAGAIEPTVVQHNSTLMRYKECVQTTTMLDLCPTNSLEMGLDKRYTD